MGFMSGQMRGLVQQNIANGTIKPNGGKFGPIKQIIQSDPRFQNGGGGMTGVVRQAVEQNPSIGGGGFMGGVKNMIAQQGNQQYGRQFMPAPFVPSGGQQYGGIFNNLLFQQQGNGYGQQYGGFSQNPLLMRYQQNAMQGMNMGGRLW